MRPVWAEELVSFVFAVYYQLRI